MIFLPEEWQIVKINGTDPHYRIFGSWRGGYATGDSWRMNSGIVRAEDIGDSWMFYGSSGSSYVCNKNSYGIRSPYNNSVLGDYVNKSDGTMEVLDTMPDVANMDWNGI